jgi:hypothetical protein
MGDGDRVGLPGTYVLGALIEMCPVPASGGTWHSAQASGSSRGHLCSREEDQLRMRGPVQWSFV